MRKSDRALQGALWEQQGKGLLRPKLGRDARLFTAVRGGHGQGQVRKRKEKRDRSLEHLGERVFPEGLRAAGTRSHCGGEIDAQAGAGTFALELVVSLGTGKRLQA